MKLSMPEKLLRVGQRGRLSGLMNLHESNYVRLLQLIPDRDIPFEAAVSRCADDADLHLRVLERCRYTTTVHLTYWFEQREGWRADPDLTVRIYRDAGVAETVDSCRSRCAFLADIDPTVGGWMERQYNRNLMLNKWLDYCLAKGHGFVMAARPRNG